MKYVYRFIWDFCELFGISLGKYAPVVFAGMLDKIYAKVEAPK